MMARQMKASGVSWIGDVPSSWNTHRIKQVCKAAQKAERSDVYVGLEHVESWGGQYKAASLQQVEPSTFQLLREGTFCFSKLRPYLAKAFIAREPLAASTEFLTYALTKHMHAPYLLYFTLSPGFIDAVNDIAGGAKMPRVNSTIFENQTISNPDLLEQIAIATYLDDRTTAIDSKIQLLEEKSKSLAELRKSVVHQAVTKGLDPSVAMKPSGVDGVGDVSNTWDVCRVGNLFELKGGGKDKKIVETEPPIKLVNYVDVYKYKKLDNTYPYMVVSCLPDKAKFISLNKNDFLITPSSETAHEIGAVNIVRENLLNTVFSYHILRLRLKTKSVAPNFAFYAFNSAYSKTQFACKATGTTRLVLSRNDILSNIFVVPPLSEQIAIAKYLDERTSIIDESIKTIADQIAAMKSLRQSLIHEAVTGKIDVADYGYQYT